MRFTIARSAAIVMPLLIATAAAAQMSPSATPAAPSSTTMAPPASASTMAPAAGAGDMSKQDKEFVMKAAQGGTAEVQMGQLALQKSQDEGVKKFAQTMIDDHTPANQKLAELATAKGVTAPTEPNAMQTKMMSKLQGMDGAKFDHAYMSGQLKSHQAMLKLFERESTNGKDTDLKSFADTNVPVIQKHITMDQNTKM